MSSRWRLDPQMAITGITAAAAVSLAAWLALSWIAHPAGFSARETALESHLAEADKLTASASGPLNHLDGSLCHDAAAHAAETLRQSLRSAIGLSGLNAASLSTGVGTGDEALGGLTPVTFAFEVSGRYDQAVALLVGLTRARPELFIDQADLKSQTSSVSLKLSGRLYCSTSAKL